MNLSLQHDTRRALVLGGGGSLGNAWLIGVVAGLCEGGVDVTGSDVIVGTSAGSTAAAQITAAPPADLLAGILEATPPSRPASPPTQAHPAAPPARPTVNYLEQTAAVIASATGPSDMRRRMGAWSLGTEGSSESAQARWRATVASRLGRDDWPTQRMLITAVDADTGEPVVFDRDSGVALADAVAASTAGTFALTIGDRRYFDGGYRTNADNADLASGYQRVVVASPFGGRSRLPAEWGMHLATQVGELRAAGSAVETIFPDADALGVFGDNMMDLSRRPAAARAGHAHGLRVAPELAGFWA